jgi:hypothetical protein
MSGNIFDSSYVIDCNFVGRQIDITAQCENDARNGRPAVARTMIMVCLPGSSGTPLSENVGSRHSLDGEPHWLLGISAIQPDPELT